MTGRRPNVRGGASIIHRPIKEYYGNQEQINKYSPFVLALSEPALSFKYIIPADFCDTIFYYLILIKVREFFRECRSKKETTQISRIRSHMLQLQLQFEKTCTTYLYNFVFYVFLEFTSFRVAARCGRLSRLVGKNKLNRGTALRY